MDRWRNGRWVGMVALLLLSGCSGLHREVVMSALPPSLSVGFVTDATQPDDYPAFLAGEGNTYSCRFGIHHMKRDEFTPPKEQIFEVLLAKELPEVKTRRVILERFDVYQNGQLAMRRAATDIVVSQYGGWKYILPNAPANERALLETNPQVPAPKGTWMVGCEDNAEGAYNGAYAQRGHNVIVTWLAFRIDGAPFVFRSNYQHKAKDKAELSQVIDRALRATIWGVAQRIRPTLSDQAKSVAPFTHPRSGAEQAVHQGRVSATGLE